MKNGCKAHKKFGNDISSPNLPIGNQNHQNIALHLLSDRNFEVTIIVLHKTLVLSVTDIKYGADTSIRRRIEQQLYKVNVRYFGAQLSFSARINTLDILFCNIDVLCCYYVTQSLCKLAVITCTHLYDKLYFRLYYPRVYCSGMA